MHKSDKIHAHTIMMHSVQALYCNWDCHWDCLRILGSYKKGLSLDILTQQVLLNIYLWVSFPIKNNEWLYIFQVRCIISWFYSTFTYYFTNHLFYEKILYFTVAHDHFLFHLCARQAVLVHQQSKQICLYRSIWLPEMIMYGYNTRSNLLDDYYR